jgi:hypothetical protein
MNTNKVDFRWILTGVSIYGGFFSASHLGSYVVGSYVVKPPFIRVHSRPFAVNVRVFAVKYCSVDSVVNI